MTKRGRGATSVGILKGTRTLKRALGRAQSYLDLPLNLLAIRAY